MNPKRLAVLHKRLEEIFGELSRIDDDLESIQDSLRDREKGYDAVFYLDLVRTGQYNDGLNSQIERLHEICSEFEGYITMTAPQKQVSKVRVVRFRGNDLQSLSSKDTTKIIMEVPTKVLEKMVEKFGFERFIEDEFEFCEREGWQRG